jgi:hypothetical protein
VIHPVIDACLDLARAPGFDQVLGGDGRFTVADFTSLA